MKFEIKRVDQDGISTLMHTDSEKCIYSDEIIKEMQRAGYKVYKDGKIYKTRNSKIDE